MRIIPHEISPLRWYAGIAIGAGTAAIAATHVVFPQLGLIAAYLIGVSVLALFFTWWDKRIAGTGAIRIPEIVLAGIGAFGGTLGLLLGAALFRHKTRKPRYLFLVLAVLLIQLIIIRLFMYPPSSE